MTEGICISCGIRGMKVLPLTIGVHLREENWDKIDDSFYFCPSPTCDVVYFSTRTGIYFRTSDLRTRVGIKETSPPSPLCYCSRVTREMLVHLIIEQRCCTTLEEVQELTGAGKGRWCLTTNPSGRCCEWYLKDIIQGYLIRAGVREQARGAQVSSPEPEKKKLVLRITGMSCRGCADVVKGILEAAGAENVRVSFEDGRAEMLIPAIMDESTFIKALEDADYGAELLTSAP